MIMIITKRGYVLRGPWRIKVSNWACSGSIKYAASFAAATFPLLKDPGNSERCLYRLLLTCLLVTVLRNINRRTNDRRLESRMEIKTTMATISSPAKKLSEACKTIS